MCRFGYVGVIKYVYLVYTQEAYIKQLRCSCICEY